MSSLLGPNIHLSALFSNTPVYAPPSVWKMKFHAHLLNHFTVNYQKCSLLALSFLKVKCTDFIMTLMNIVTNKGKVVPVL
jgi:hypothetical protein